MTYIPLFKVMMTPVAKDAVAQVLDSGFIGQGAVVDEFEKELERITPYGVVSMNSCTSSIHAVLMYLGVGPGDEVICPPLTCVASIAPVLAVGARPVWADVDRTTGNINEFDVAMKVNRRTKAIIAVNWTGRPPDYAGLCSTGIPVIEDAAHGPLIGDRATGDFICYSFGPIKHLTCGDGGAVSTPNPAARAALRLLRWYGLDRTSSKDFRCAQDIQEAGMKFHMNDINASIGLANLKKLQSVVLRHQINAGSLWAELGDLPFLEQIPFSVSSNYWVFPIKLYDPEDRDKLKLHLENCGIMSSQVHARVDHHSAYKFPNGDLPGLDEYDSCHLNIPCGWWVTDEQRAHIIASVRSFAL